MKGFPAPEPPFCYTIKSVCTASGAEGGLIHLPIYEYRCLKCGHQFEKMQKISDRPVSRCEKCNERVTRVFHPVAIHFKGSGFYTTDYARKRADSRQKTSEKTPAETPAKTGGKPARQDKSKPRKKAAAGSKEG